MPNQSINKEQESEDLLHLLVSSVVDYAIILLDPTGLIVSWNEGAQRIKGYSSDDIIGRHFSCFYSESDILAGKPEKELAEAAELGRIEDLGWRLKKDGSVFFASVVITALKDKRGKLRGFGKVTRDMTERKIVEDNLIKSQEELKILNLELGLARDRAQESSKFKSEFMANMSHEIRTPMNGIVGMCNILLTTKMSDEQRHFANSIKDASNALLTIVNDVLDFSKIEAGRIVLDLGGFNPVQVIENACEILSPIARQKKLSLMCFIDPDLPSKLLGDRERLRQILINLLGNAIKFADCGEITVRAALTSVESNIANVHFSVSDSGIGLADEEISKLFQPFTQADGTISRKFGGTGLGLSICKNLVELMQGEIGVDSVKGKGSTFWFNLPLAIQESRPVISVKEKLSGVRVLVVDDEISAREIIHRYVISWGMRNGTASSVDEALRLLRQASLDGDPYKVAIVDLVMPGKTGLDLARELVKYPALSATKLILLTAFDAPGLGLQAIELGFKGYVTKPVRQSQLLDCLLEVNLGNYPFISSGAADSMYKDTSGVKIARKDLILVAEDHPINQQVAQLYLDRLGFPCHIVSNGREAIEAVKKFDYSLVLMDCQMPEMDGLEATAEIRKIEAISQKRVPIIAMTASAMQGDREICLKAGMDDYVSKPIDLEPLRKVIDHWLPDSKARALENVHLQAEINRLSVPIDLQQLDRLYEDHSERLISLFLIEVPLQITRINEAIRETDARVCLDAAHGLKGLCFTLFAGPMAEICTQLEASGKIHDWKGCLVFAVQLHYEFSRLQDYLTSEKR